MTDQKRRKKYPFSVERRVGIFISALVLIVSISGIITYQNLISVIKDVKKGASADSRADILKQINTDLYETESNVRAFYLTRDSIYLHSYDSTRLLVKNLLVSLKAGETEDTKGFHYLDTVSNLVHAKYALYDEWIAMKDHKGVTNTLNTIPEKLKSDKLAETENLQGNKKQKKKKLNKKQQASQEAALNTVDINKVEKEIITVKKKQNYQLKELNFMSQDMNLRNKELNDAFRDLITRIEKEERNEIAASNTLAIEKASVTNFIIAVFCTSSVLMLIIIAVVLNRYIKTAKAYNQALKDARREAENLAMAKQNFLANMTHELRTPINAILGFTDQLNKTRLDESQAEQLTIVRKSSTHLLKIVNDVLDYSKLQSGKFSFEKIIFNPEETIGEVIEILQPQAREKKIQMVYDLVPPVPENLRGDPFRLQQILLNIIGNAVKFTGSGNIYVIVSAEMNESLGMLLKVEVKDTGIGIPQEKINTVFNDFEQVSPQINSKYKGTGLGLSISKKLVEYQRGSIHMYSREGKGTVVNITIPYELVEGAEISKEKKTIGNFSFLKNRKILIVDDEEYNRKLLVTILGHWGVTTEQAVNGREALQMAAANVYDLVLMDIRMPEMTGIQATVEIRALKEKMKNSVPIIALTATNDNEKEKVSIEAGMNAFLTKPFTEESLLEVLRQVIEGKERVGHETPKEHPSLHPSGSISIEELKKASNGDEKFIQEMLLLFIKGTEEGIKNIKDAFFQHNYTMVREQAHKISSPCRHMGAMHLLELIKELEATCREDTDKEALALLVAAVIKESEIVIAETKKHLS